MLTVREHFVKVVCVKFKKKTKNSSSERVQRECLFFFKERTSMVILHRKTDQKTITNYLQNCFDIMWRAVNQIVHLLSILKDGSEVCLIIKYNLDKIILY